MISSFGMDANKTDVCFRNVVGKGRPAWNIQDAAIVTKHLGFTVDVGCGGIDNLVRHHDYTLAVAEAVSVNSSQDIGCMADTCLWMAKKCPKAKAMSITQLIC